MAAYVDQLVRSVDRREQLPAEEGCDQQIAAKTGAGDRRAAPATS
jgi:hypothetical protein